MDRRRRLVAVLTIAAAAGYLLHLLDETRFGLAFEPLFVGPTLGALAAALSGLIGHRDRPAYAAAGLAGLVVAYFGGLGHLLTPRILYPIPLTDGAGGVLVGVNAAIGLALATVAWATLWASWSSRPVGDGTAPTRSGKPPAPA